MSSSQIPLASRPWIPDGHSSPGSLVSLLSAALASALELSELVDVAEPGGVPEEVDWVIDVAGSAVPPVEPLAVSASVTGDAQADNAKTSTPTRRPRWYLTPPPL